jgi:release factor glutamine methyltransferase
MTVKEVLFYGTSLLRSANIETPQLDASLILAHLLRVEKSRLILMYNDFVSDETFCEFENLMKRRTEGENVAYLIGKKEFWGLAFKVNASVLVPRPDTEILVEAALNWIKSQAEKTLQRNFRVIDICTGSGAIAVALKHECSELIVEASDISEAALAVASENVRNLLGEKSITLHQSNLLNDIPGTFDAIVSNPPYVPTKIISSLSKEVQREPLLALDGGEDGLDLIRTLISAASKKLNPNGKIFLEADSEQMSAIKGLLQECGFVDIELVKDLAGLNRVISGRKYHLESKSK